MNSSPTPTGISKVITLYVPTSPFTLYWVGDVAWLTPGTFNGKAIPTTDPIKGTNLGGGSGRAWVNVTYDDETGLFTGTPTIRTGTFPVTTPTGQINLNVCNYDASARNDRIKNWGSGGSICVELCRNYAAEKAPKSYVLYQDGI